MAPSRSNTNNQDKREERKKTRQLVVTRYASLSGGDRNETTTSRRRYRPSIPPLSPSLHQEGSNTSTTNLLLLNHPLLRQHHGCHDTAPLNSRSNTIVWSTHHCRLDHHAGLPAKRTSSLAARHLVLTSKQIMDIIDMALELTKDVCDDDGGNP